MGTVVVAHLRCILVQQVHVGPETARGQYYRIRCQLLLSSLCGTVGHPLHPPLILQQPCHLQVAGRQTGRQGVGASAVHSLRCRKVLQLALMALELPD